MINQISGSFVEMVLWSGGLDKTDTGEMDFYFQAVFEPVL